MIRLLSEKVDWTEKKSPSVKAHKAAKKGIVIPACIALALCALWIVYAEFDVYKWTNPRH
jgi:hypothetical protein